MEHNGINKTIAIFALAAAVTSTVITASASTFTIEGSDNSFTIRRSGDTTYFTPLGVTVDGTDGIVADANGNIFLWLPDGDWSGIVTDIVYPTYLDGAHELVKSNYVAWATSYGVNTNPECEGRFLLGISPATAIPEGAAMLKVVDFGITDKVLHLELASDVCDLSQPAEWSGTPMLCNGFLTLEFAFDLEAFGTPGGA